MMNADSNMAEERLEVIRSRIATALLGSPRKPTDVTLIAVSKGHGPDAIREIYRLGVRDFGESYAQEFCKKAEELQDLKDIRWHFIGHLQSNKLKKIIPFQPILHSVDRLSLVRELAKNADPAHPIRALIQLQVDPNDLNKSGCPRDEAEGICRELVQIPGLVWDGFMGIGPAETSREQLGWLYEQFNHNAQYLWEKYALRDPSRRLRAPSLSLGMSDDLEVALRSGSTMLRIGTALFGPRPSKPQAT